MLFLLPALAAPPMSTSFVGYPPGGEGDITCMLHIVTNGKVEPEGVMVSGCPYKFRKMVRKALKTWKWTEGDTPHVEEWKILFFQRSPYAKSRQIAELEQPVDQLVGKRHRTSLDITKRVAQKYPAHADGKSGTCKTELWIEAASGRVDFVTIEGCEEVFHDVTYTAAYAWEFAPIEGEHRWIRTKVAFDYEEPPEIPPLEDWTDVLELTEQGLVVSPARTRKHRPATCLVVVTVDESGRAGSADEIAGCDESLHIAAENAARRNRWKHLGDPQPQRIVVPVFFPK